MERPELARASSLDSETAQPDAIRTNSAALRRLPRVGGWRGNGALQSVWFPPADPDAPVEVTATTGLLACLREEEGLAAAPSPAAVGGEDYAAAAAAARRVQSQLHREPLLCGRGSGAPNLNDFSIFDGVPEAERKELLALALRDEHCMRAVGSMIGMAVADAVGHMFEFLAVGEPGHFFDPEALTCDGVYNRFKLKPGQWTDDTSMGLCLADSLLVHGGYDGTDLRQRFWNWWFKGYNNAFRLDESRSDSVGLGGNIKASLARMASVPTPRFEELGSSEDAGNGSLMRLAPVPVLFHRDPVLAASVSAESSLTTHPGPIAADACSFTGFVIARAISRPADSTETAAAFLDACCAAYLELPMASGQKTLLKLLRAQEPPGSTERCWNWRDPEGPYLMETLVARGSFYNGYEVDPDYFGSYSMDGLAIALHSVYHTSSFMEAIAKCINFLGDSDSHGSICGQLAGAFYGARAVDERLVAAMEVWDQGEVALRAAALYGLGTDLSQTAAAGALAAAGGGNDRADKHLIVEHASPADKKVPWVPPSVARKKQRAENDAEQVAEAAQEADETKHILEIMASGDDELSGGFAVYPRTHCPHLETAQLSVPHTISMNARCAVCGEDEIWICATTGIALCSRYKNAHMKEHSAKDGHPVGLSLSDLSFWCFKCDAYLDVFAIKALHPLYTKAHIAKFGEPPPLPTGSSEAAPAGSSSSSSSSL